MPQKKNPHVHINPQNNLLLPTFHPNDRLLNGHASNQLVIYPPSLPLCLSPTTIAAKLGACLYDNVVTGGVCQLEAESISPQLASSLGTSTLHHALSGMEENDKKENGEYTGEIKGGMRPSMKLVVMGIINKKPHSMEVILSSEPQEEDSEGDVGLQLKVSFMDKAVQRNARMAGKWGRPETTLSYFPFAPGESFKMEIVCEHQQFRILVDGQPLCGFSHRVPRLASLTALRVCGDLQLTKVA